jgi:hypothetical protein
MYNCLYENKACSLKLAACSLLLARELKHYQPIQLKSLTMRRVIILGALALALLSFTYGCADTANSDSSNYDTTQQHNTNTGGNASPERGLDTTVTIGGTIGNDNNANTGNQDTGTQGGRDTL